MATDLVSAVGDYYSAVNELVNEYHAKKRARMSESKSDNFDQVNTVATIQTRAKLAQSKRWGKVLSESTEAAS